MAINASTSYMSAGNYTSAWASIYSLYFPPEIWNEWYEKYGKGFKVLDFLNMAGRSMPIANRTFYHFEDGTDLRVATVGTQIAVTAAGANATLTTLAATDYDANGNGPLRANFTLVIPDTYLNNTGPRLYVCTAIAGNGAAQAYTLSPLSADSEINVAIPVNTELMIGPSVYAPGTGQPEGMTQGTYKRTHYTQISKESCGFEGGQVGKRNYREVVDMAGNPRIFDRGMVETEFRLDRQMDSALFLGEPNTNALTQTSVYGGTPNRQGTEGLWTWMTALAQSKTYAGDFDMDDFDDIKPLLQSQGLVDSTVLFGYGSNLGLSVENTLLDGGLKEWSGGTDLLKGNYFEVEFKKAMKNNVRFLFKEMVSFANPNTYGNDSYDFTDSGFMLPVTDVPVTTMAGEKITVPNLATAFYNHKGEDRTRIIGTVAGLNGMGYDIKNEYDGTAIFMLTEYALFAANVNQFIKITKV